MTNSLVLRFFLFILLFFLGCTPNANGTTTKANSQENTSSQETKIVEPLQPSQETLLAIEISEKEDSEVHTLQLVNEPPETVGIMKPVLEDKTTAEEVHVLVPITTSHSTQQVESPSETQNAYVEPKLPVQRSIPENNSADISPESAIFPNYEEANIAPNSTSLEGNAEITEDVPCTTFPTFTKFVSRGEVEGKSYHCGYIHVPEEHDNLSSPTLKLGYIILKSTSNNPSPIPFLMIQGGPGGSSIELVAAYAFWGSNPALATVRSQRDIIAIDYRGSTYSLPRLICPTPQSMILHRATSPNVDDVHVKKQTLQACFSSWQQRGVNLSAFNSIEIANDYALALTALGYPQVHVYGGSYGSIAAQYIMRDYPELLHSVILDAPVAPYLHWPLNTPQAANSAFKHLFENCKADINCQQNYPDLEKVFITTVDKLNEQPVSLTLTINGQKQEAKLNGDLWVQGLYELMYRNPGQVRSNIFRTSIGDYSAASNILADIVAYKSIFSPPEETFVVSSGLYMSVTCADEFTFTDADWDFTGLIPQVARPVTEYLDNDLPELCSAWPVPLLDKRLKEPVISDIPTLVFSAKFDPVTPPAYAEKIVENLSRAHLYISSTDGHSVLNNSCTWQIINDFLNNPFNLPNNNCFEVIRTSLES